MSPSTASCPTPQGGELLLVAPSPGICLVAFAKEGRLLRTSLRTSSSLELEFCGDEKSEALKAELGRWLLSYSRGSSSPFSTDPRPGFFGRALSAIAAVPFGETRSYSEIAGEAGNPRAARAAGTACCKNPFPLLIPCHRILPRSGSLGNYLYGLEMKAALLDFESAKREGG